MSVGWDWKLGSNPDLRVLIWLSSVFPGWNFFSRILSLIIKINALFSLSLLHRKYLKYYIQAEPHLDKDLVSLMQIPPYFSSRKKISGTDVSFTWWIYFEWIEKVFFPGKLSFLFQKIFSEKKNFYYFFAHCISNKYLEKKKSKKKFS